MGLLTSCNNAPQTSFPTRSAGSNDVKGTQWPSGPSNSIDFHKEDQRLGMLEEKAELILQVGYTDFQITGPTNHPFVGRILKTNALSDLDGHPKMSIGLAILKVPNERIVSIRGAPPIDSILDNTRIAKQHLSRLGFSNIVVETFQWGFRIELPDAPR
jgi:hypothetical protein